MAARSACRRVLSTIPRTMPTTSAVARIEHRAAAEAMVDRGRRRPDHPARIGELGRRRLELGSSPTRPRSRSGSAGRPTPDSRARTAVRRGPPDGRSAGWPAALHRAARSSAMSCAGIGGDRSAADRLDQTRSDADAWHSPTPHGRPSAGCRPRQRRSPCRQSRCRACAVPACDRGRPLGAQRHPAAGRWGGATGGGWIGCTAGWAATGSVSIGPGRAAAGAAAAAGDRTKSSRAAMAT